MDRPALRAKLPELLGIDLRTLAAFRIGIGGLLFVNLATRLPYIRALYADDGVLPRTILWAKVPDPAPLALHTLSGEFGFQVALFVLALALAAMLTVGWFTRVAAIGSWLLWWSLVVRSPMLAEGADQLTRVLLFWMMFLPLGARWSVDARGREPPAGGHVVSVAAFALLLQVVFVYFFTALLKAQAPSWFPDFTAVHYALGNGQVSRPFGLFLQGYPALTQLATAGVLAFEVFVPVLMFSPFGTARVRIALIALTWFLQLSLALGLRLAMFPLVNAVAILVFLPGCVWDRLGIARGRARETSSSAWSRLAGAAAALALLYLVTFNLSTVTDFYAPRPVLLAGYALGLNQHWVMFRAPGKISNVPDVRGFLADRQQVDLRVGGDADWEYVRDLHDQGNFYVYYRRLDDDWFDPMRTSYARWLCQQWNADPSRTRLVGVQMDMLSTPIGPPGGTPGRTIRKPAWRRTCD